MDSLDNLQTESRNPASTNLDELTPLEIVRLMNAEDAKVIPAVASQAETIARAIEIIVDRLRAGGRLVYVGAGTSGRLGVLDATECPPTFNAPPGQVVGLIAGGPAALTRAVEGAEDDPALGQSDLQAIGLSAADVVVGIATSGRTPYVLGAIDFARRCGAFTIGLSCNPGSELTGCVDLALTPVVGPEVLSGSTRLKAGTATKLVLNTLTTGAMVRLEKVFGNLMVDLRATNAKLRVRTTRIVREITGLDRTAAEDLLDHCGWELKTAVVAHLAGLSAEESRTRLRANGERVRPAVAWLAPADQTAAPRDLVLGVDGGGTRTVALLAAPSPDGGWRLLGRGEGGPANRQTVGSLAAFAALEGATERAFASAGLIRRPVRVACLGLAGAGRPEDQLAVRTWATSTGLGDSVEVLPDVVLLLAAGTPDRWGVAVVAGTGSIAFGRSPDGRTARAGGWGPLLGDEGSGHALALAGLRAVAHAADGRGPETLLTARFLVALGIARPAELVGAVYPRDRTAVAALAPVVLEAADSSDSVASALVHDAAAELAAAAVAAAGSLSLGTCFPLALAGGLLLKSATFRQAFLRALDQRGIQADPVTLVQEPAEGAVRLALDSLRTPNS